MPEIPLLINRSVSAYSFVKDGYWRITTATFRGYKGPRKVFEGQYSTPGEARKAAFKMGFGKFYQRLPGRKETYFMHLFTDSKKYNQGSAINLEV